MRQQLANGFAKGPQPQRLFGRLGHDGVGDDVLVHGLLQESLDPVLARLGVGPHGFDQYVERVRISKGCRTAQGLAGGLEIVGGNAVDFGVPVFCSVTTGVVVGTSAF